MPVISARHISRSLAWLRSETIQMYNTLAAVGSPERRFNINSSIYFLGANYRNKYVEICCKIHKIKSLKDPIFAFEINDKHNFQAMSKIRLFTSGTHNGLTFSNDDIKKIAKQTADFGEDQIPFVLGHPKTNLPILGFLPKTQIQLYTEGDKVSLGFEKDNADMSDESLEALRSLGQNKLSVRLREGIIRHVGLVKKAAVSENNSQDFAELSGTFESQDLLFEESSNGIIKSIQNIFKPMEKTEQTATDFAVTNEKLDKLAENLTKVVDILGAQTVNQAKATITNDFASAEFSHLTDEKRKEYADFCATLPADKQDTYKAQIRAINVKPTPVNGSATTDFAAKEGDKSKQSAQDIIKNQMSNL